MGKGKRGKTEVIRRVVLPESTDAKNRSRFSASARGGKLKEGKKEVGANQRKKKLAVGPELVRSGVEPGKRERIVLSGRSSVLVGECTLEEKNRDQKGKTTYVIRMRERGRTPPKKKGGLHIAEKNSEGKWKKDSEVSRDRNGRGETKRFNCKKEGKPFRRQKKRQREKGTCQPVCLFSQLQES